MKILMVTPSFPHPESGAEQMDRAAGIRQLVRLGHAVVVITKVTEWADTEAIQHAAGTMGVRVVLVPYCYSNRTLSFYERVKAHLGKLKNLLYLDGAAYEYAEPVIQARFAEELATFKPDVAWFEYTYLWPLYAPARKAGARIVTRSLNFEPTHFLEEDGHSLINYFKYIPKWLSERSVARMSDLILALNPNEARLYTRLGAKKVEVLPLRSLPALLRPHKTGNGVLHVSYMGSSYLVAHNRQALAFVIEEVAPRINAQYPGQFIFHIFGAKVPQDLMHFFNDTVVHEGYKERAEFDAAIDRMDIALSPSKKAVGMQQKVFEPLARSLPLVTTEVNLVGYPFVSGEHYLAAHTLNQYVAALASLCDPAKRDALSKNAQKLTSTLFSEQALDATVRDALASL